MISLQLPYPPSVNHYWGVSGKQRFIGKKGKEFRQAVAEACLDAQIQTMDGRLAVHVAIWPPDNRKRDVDNTLKPLLLMRWSTPGSTRMTARSMSSTSSDGSP
jgi:crossover junction endodeoxyribonuclease RusA